MLARLSLRKNFSWVMAGNLAYAGTRWAMLVALAHLGDAAMMGQLVLAFAVCAPVCGFADLGLRTILITDARNEHPFADYLLLRIVTATLALVALFGFLAVVRYSPTLTVVVAGVAIGRTFESLSDIFHGLLQRFERMDRPAIAMIVRETLGVVLLTAGVWATGSLAWGIWGFAVALAAVFFAYDLPQGLRMLAEAHAAGALRSESTGDDQRLVARLARLAWVSAPAGGTQLLSRLHTNLPRYFIQFYIGELALGIYGAVASLAVAGRTFIGALGQASAPRLVQYYVTGNRRAFIRLLAGMFVGIGALGAVATLTMVILGGPILHLLYHKPEITAAANVAVWVMVAAAISYLDAPLARAIGAMRRFHLQVSLRGLAMVVMGILMLWMVPAHGLLGAAWAMILGSALSTAICFWFVIVELRRCQPPADASGQGETPSQEIAAVSGSRRLRRDAAETVEPLGCTPSFEVQP